MFIVTSQYKFTTSPTVLDTLNSSPTNANRKPCNVTTPQLKISTTPDVKIFFSMNKKWIGQQN